MGKIVKIRLPIALLTFLVLVSGTSAYDITLDRGALAQSVQMGGRIWKDGDCVYTPLFQEDAFNVGKDMWGPVEDCSTNWSAAQWRRPDGKRIKSADIKPTQHQTDMEPPLSNGWFTPDPKVGGNQDCTDSHISRGWQDSYGHSWPSGITNSDLQAAVNPTFHDKLDPNGNILPGDVNRTNNEAWVTTGWDPGLARFVPLENLDIPSGTLTLTSSDSVYYGPYSTNQANGNITITNRNRSNYLTDGNEKIGYQGRRMRVTLTGGSKNLYQIRNGSKVTAEFLGQNSYRTLFTPGPPGNCTGF